MNPIQVRINPRECAEWHLRGLIQHSVPLRLAANPRTIASRRGAQVPKSFGGRLGLQKWQRQGRGRGREDAAGAHIAPVPRSPAAHCIARGLCYWGPVRAKYRNVNRLGHQHKQFAHRMRSNQFCAPLA